MCAVVRAVLWAQVATSATSGGGGTPCCCQELSLSLPPRCRPSPPDLITLCLLRTCVGFAVGAKLPVCTAILIELIPSSDRGVYGLLLSGIAFACGEMFVCLAGIAIHSVDNSKDWWRSLLLACVIPDVFAFPLAWRFVPESPSWLITRGRHEEVEELLQEVALTNTGSTDCLLQGGRIRRVKEEPDKEEKWADIFDEIGQLFSPKLRQISICA